LRLRSGLEPFVFRDIAALVAVIAAWFAVVFTARYPSGLSASWKA
jgi:hypothetical protein